MLTSITFREKMITKKSGGTMPIARLELKKEYRLIKNLSCKTLMEKIVKDSNKKTENVSLIL
jgi:hypothetical protein